MHFNHSALSMFLRIAESANYTAFRYAAMSLFKSNSASDHLMLQKYSIFWYIWSKFNQHALKKALLLSYLFRTSFKLFFYLIYFKASVKSISVLDNYIQCSAKANCKVIK